MVLDKLEDIREAIQTELDLYDSMKGEEIIKRNKIERNEIIKDGSMGFWWWLTNILILIY